MFHKIIMVEPMENFRLKVEFADGSHKIFNVKPLFDVWEIFRTFEKNPDLFKEVEVIPGGNGIVWNDEIDLFCEDLYEYGEEI